MGDIAIHLAGDVGDPNFCRYLVEEANSKLGSPHILVNNAGIIIIHPAVEFPEEDWKRTLDVNLNSAFYCSKAVAQVMLKKRYGKIINITSENSSYITGEAFIIDGGWTSSVLPQVQHFNYN